MDIVNDWDNEKPIVVTGPPMAGTLIVAKLLAERLDLPLLRDEDTSIEDLNMALFQAHLVIEAPNLAHLVHQFTMAYVVYVLRPVDEILADMEIAEYDDRRYIRNITSAIDCSPPYVVAAFEDSVDMTKSLPVILYSWWTGFQRDEISFWFGDWAEVSYASVRDQLDQGEN